MCGSPPKKQRMRPRFSGLSLLHPAGRAAPCSGQSGAPLAVKDSGGHRGGSCSPAATEPCHARPRPRASTATHLSCFISPSSFFFAQTLVECPRQTACWARVGHGAGQGMRPGTCCGRATLVGGLPRASRAARAVGRLGGGLQPRPWTPTLGPEPRGGAGPVWGVWRPEAACAQDGAA